jgi:4a-hydroxytetrahydrobiopterin dehydratase
MKDTEMKRLDYSEIISKLQKGWTFNPDKNEIEKDFDLGNFTASAAFISKIADVAESLDHHPDLLLHDYKMVRVSIATHAAGGITDLDFTLAQKIDDL